MSTVQHGRVSVVAVDLENLRIPCRQDRAKSLEASSKARNPRNTVILLW